MGTMLSGTLFVGGAMILSAAGLFLVRRFADLGWLKRHHEVASYFFLMIGTLYAVLIAFAIFVVWTGFRDAGANLEAEANEAGDLSRLSMDLPPPLRQNIQAALLEYLNSVTEDEFPAMAEGRSSQRTWNAVEKLWNVYGTGQPDNLQMQAVYAESLRHLNALSNARRVRLFTSRGTVPAALWGLLSFGGILLVAFTYLFGHESVWSQAAMTAALAGVLAFSLFLIISLDSPYAGVTRVTPQPFKLELQHVAARGGH